MTILFSLGYGRERTGFFLGQYEIESMHSRENVGFYLPPLLDIIRATPKHPTGAARNQL